MQRDNQRKAEQRERLKRGQYHATAAVLELSRIDDEALIEPSFSLTKTTDKDGKGKRVNTSTALGGCGPYGRHLHDSQADRELPAHSGSHRAQGPSYRDPLLPSAHMLRGAKIDPIEKSKAIFFTGGNAVVTEAPPSFPLGTESGAHNQYANGTLNGRSGKSLPPASPMAVLDSASAQSWRLLCPPPRRCPRAASRGHPSGRWSQARATSAPP